MPCKEKITKGALKIGWPTSLTATASSSLETNTSLLIN